MAEPRPGCPAGVCTSRPMTAGLFPPMRPSTSHGARCRHRDTHAKPRNRTPAAGGSESEAYRGRPPLPHRVPGVVRSAAWFLLLPPRPGPLPVRGTRHRSCRCGGDRGFLHDPQRFVVVIRRVGRGRRRDRRCLARHPATAAARLRRPSVRQHPFCWLLGPRRRHRFGRSSRRCGDAPTHPVLQPCRFGKRLQMGASPFYNADVPRIGCLRLSVCVSALRLRPNATSYGRPPGWP